MVLVHLTFGGHMGVAIAVLSSFTWPHFFPPFLWAVGLLSWVRSWAVWEGLLGTAREYTSSASAIWTNWSGGGAERYLCVYM